MTDGAAPRGPSLAARAWRSYFEASAMLEAELERRMKADSEMDLGDFNLLLVLSEAPDHRLRLGALARAVAFGKARLTYRIGALSRRGWVKRERAKKDGRGVLAVLTPAGRAALTRARPVHGRHIRELMMSDVDDAHAQALLEVFDGVRDRLHRLPSTDR